MVIKVEAFPYQCEVCKKIYSTENQAVDCENSHEDTSQKGIERREGIRNQLIEIRNTSTSFKEIEQRALTVLKARYGDDFVLQLPELGEGRSNARGCFITCTHLPSKKVDVNDYYVCWRNTEVNSYKIILDLGFKITHRSDDGAIYKYALIPELDYSIWPAINAMKMKRERSVWNAEQNIARIAGNYLDKVNQDNNVIVINNHLKSLNIQMESIQDSLDSITEKKEQYIKDKYYQEYEQECDKIVSELPQQFKKIYPDPCPSRHFYYTTS